MGNCHSLDSSDSSNDKIVGGRRDHQRRRLRPAAGLTLTVCVALTGGSGGEAPPVPSTGQGGSVDRAKRDAGQKSDRRLHEHFGLDIGAINRNLTKGRVVAVGPPLTEDDVTLPPLPANMANRFEPLPTGVPIVIIEIDNDEAVARGLSTAGAEPAQAPVFRQDRDSVYFNPNKDDTGNFVANQMFFGNGFQVGDSITGYDLLVYNSRSFSGDATAIVELWDGDPLAIDDTACSAGGIPQAIGGTQATFSALVQGTTGCLNVDPTEQPTCVGLYRLKATLGAPVQINCDHVWMVLSLSDGCRLGWRWNGYPPLSGSGFRASAPQVGFSDAVEQMFDCGQFGLCATATGYNVGTCCDHGFQGVCSGGTFDGGLCNLAPNPGDPTPCVDGGGTCNASPGAACDHTDGTTDNDCAGDFGSGRELTFCTDGVAEFADRFSLQPDGYASFQASIYTDAQGVYTLTPVSSSDPAADIAGGEITMAAGNQVTLDITVAGWDPNLLGTPQLKGWQFTIDSSGYSSGLQGDILPYAPGCSIDADCVAAVGTGSTCDGGACTGGFIDTTRPDYVYAGTASIEGVGRTSLDYSYFGTIDVGGTPLTDPGTSRYVGTLVLQVPDNADGSFEIGIQTPGVSSFLADQNDDVIPFLGVEPVRIHIYPGACCAGSSCSELTRTECADQEGYFLGSGTTCSGQCALGACCVPPTQCEDGSGAGLDQTTCENTLGGRYVGGGRCTDDPSPCGFCPMEGSDNCQPFGTGSTVKSVVLSDLAGFGGQRIADDFRPNGSQITHVCVQGVYVDTVTGDDCQVEVNDVFTVRVYDHDATNFTPGSPVGESLTTVLSKGVEGPFAELDLWRLQLGLNDPISVTPGVCHWIEIVNNTALPAGNTCQWHWSGRRSDGDPRDGNDTAAIQYNGLSWVPTTMDLVFCLNVPFDAGGEGVGGCGNPTAACCTCSGTCSEETIMVCHDDFVDSTWDAAEPSCAAVTCATSAYGDTCAEVGSTCPGGGVCVGGASDGQVCIGAEDCLLGGCACDNGPILVTDGLQLTNNNCSSTDGPNPTPNPAAPLGETLGSDIWYRYEATCTGTLTVSMCGTASDWAGGHDSYLAVYHDPVEPGVCPCPSDNANLWPAAMAFDETCNGILDGGAGIGVGDVSTGDCLLIRVGGFQGDQGVGVLEISCEPDEPFADCNNNGIDDLQDIANLTSQDCNGNLEPDECEPQQDCNNNLTLDVCDIATAVSDDCNKNDVPDECEIDKNSGAPGGPFYCNVDCDPDCNGNGILDSCDIAACWTGSPDYPDCNDCNNNGVPDECDDPVDSMPDECVEWQGGSTGNFNEGSNWPGGVVPGSSDSVTIGEVGAATTSSILAPVPATVTVDSDATVGTLSLVDGGTLEVTEPTPADLDVVGEGGIAVEGNLFVDNDRVIDSSAGPVVIGEGGKYQADPDATGTVSASLLAASVTIEEGSAVGGEMTLIDSMSVTVSGDVSLNGSATTGTASVAGACFGPLSALPLGITPPPKLYICGSVILGAAADSGAGASGGIIEATPVAGALSLDGNFQMTAASLAVNKSPVGMVLGGNFDNQALYPSLFDWTGGRLLMNGAAPQTFEVAGLDLDAIEEGFLTDRDTLFDTDQHTNFAMGVIEVAAGRNVTFVNNHRNTVGAGECIEALYVDELILGAESTITADNCKVYARNVIGEENAAVKRVGCGNLLPMCFPSSTPVTPTVVDELTLGMNRNTATVGASIKNRFISVAGSDPGKYQAIRVRVVNLPAPYDVWNGMDLWVDSVREVCENAGSVDPACPSAPGLPKKTFWAATLTCDPDNALFEKWTTYDLPIHIYNEVIVPNGQYEIAFADLTCSLSDDNSYSDPPLSITQAKWADIVDNCGKDPCSAPNGVVAVATDVTAVLDKFKNLSGAPIKPRADLVGIPPNDGELDLKIQITDVTWSLNAFVGAQYSFSAGDPCDGS